MKYSVIGVAPWFSKHEYRNLEIAQFIGYDGIVLPGYDGGWLKNHHKADWDWESVFN